MKRSMLRTTMMIVWLALALITVGTVWAQEGGEAIPLGDTITQPQPVVPNNLDGIAARLAPLLVGAALIERALEFLFNWVERAILDASHRLNALATRFTGLVQMDWRQTWQQLNQLTNALVLRGTAGQSQRASNAASDKPEDWPLAKLEAQIEQTQKTLAAAEKVIKTTLKSPEYVARKKMTAAWSSMLMGILLAIITNLRLFQPLGVEVANSFKDTFDVIDLVLAGILMGLGTDWVHQVIGLLIKGKGLLGRAAGGEEILSAQLNPDQVRMLAEIAVKNEFEAQIQRLREEVGRGAAELLHVDDSPG